MKTKDWNGNSASVFATIGASNHFDSEREPDDYYATDPIAIDILLDAGVEFNKDAPLWEPACGEGHLSKRLIERGYNVVSTDLIDRGYGRGGIDFLGTTGIWSGDIITNPPYKYAKEFVEHALEVIHDGGKVAMFLKLTFLEGKSRKSLFEKYPPKLVLVSSSRIHCCKNGDFSNTRQCGSAVAYAWYIWEKGYSGDIVTRVVN